MKVMRRSLVGWSLVALFAILCFGKTLAAETAPELTVGIVSDIHLSRPERHKSQGAIDAFLRVLGFFKEKSVDSIVIAGDLTNGGTADELKVTAECWEQVFGSLSSGPVKVFVTGNHENNYSKEAKERWREILQEPDTPFFIKRVKGYAFVGAHWAAWNDERAFRGFLQEHSGDIVGDKPFFYIQHAHPQHTCYGDWIWHRPDGGPTDKVLADYPNAVAFSGHTHYSLTDERSIWQGAFTSIGTASLRWLSLPAGRENGKGLKQIGHRMSDIASDYGPSQGLVMRVRGDRMVFERYDLSKMEKLGPDWDVRTLRSAGDPRPYGFAERKACLKAPEFPEGAKVTVSVVSGRSPEKTPERQVVLKFPAATAEDAASRVYDYEVSAELVSGDCVLPWRTKRVFQPGLPLSVERQAATAACVYGAGELPPPPFRFAVTPMNAFGKRGKTIYLQIDKKAAEVWSTDPKGA